jgi:hypothetical protein
MLVAAQNTLRFEIVPNYVEVGVYLFVYENDKCVRDDLQNDVKTFQNVAFEAYGVPLTQWGEAP